MPSNLAEQGRKLWRDVNAAYALRPDELRVLEQAARVLDVIAELDAAMVGQPLITKGSAGQVREHPLLSECRQQRAILARLLGQLGLPDEPSSSRPDSASHAARRMAHARWSRP